MVALKTFKNLPPERQEEIILVSLEEFALHEYETASLSAIISKLDLAKGSFYRYFENKHRLLIYITAWYWSWLEYRVVFSTTNIKDPEKKLKKVIQLLANTVEDDIRTSYVNETILHQIIIAEGTKAYLTKHVTEDNKDQLFKPYKDLCAKIGDIILEYNPKYKYPKSLSSTIIEMAHFQNYFMHNLPSLTDFGKEKDEAKIVSFLENLVFCSLKK